MFERAISFLTWFQKDCGYIGEYTQGFESEIFSLLCSLFNVFKALPPSITILCI